MNEQLQQFTRQLENGRLVQSFLVSGPEKTGKFRAVVKMTEALNNLTSEQVKLAYKGEMADIILIETEISKQQARDTTQENNPLQDTSKLDTKDQRIRKPKSIITKKQIDSAMKGVGLKNFQLSKKVIIIKDANKMTNTAANSLLKLIEEPSSNLVIFLLVNNENDILATIKSRCQAIRFSFTKDEQINKIIQEEYSTSKKILPIIVDLAGGRIELARQYASSPKKIKLAQKIRNDFREALRGGKLEQIKLVDNLIKDNEDLLWVINEWIWYLKFFLEKNIQGDQPVAIIKKVHAILKNLLKTRDLIRATNSSKKVQLENFFIQI